MKSKTVFVAVAVVVSFLFVTTVHASKSSRGHADYAAPNIIFVMADDIGWR